MRDAFFYIAAVIIGIIACVVMITSSVDCAKQGGVLTRTMYNPIYVCVKQ